MKKYFAKLDENNTVLEVVHKYDQLSIEEIIDLLRSEFNHPYWISIDPNGVFRKGFPSKHWKFDPIKNAFISPRPFPSWTFDDTNSEWVAPVAKPEETEEEFYIWNEENYYATGTGWVLVIS